MTNSNDQKRGKIKFTKRKGIFLVIMAPLLFLLSGLFLANTLIYTSESIPYQVGQLLCFVVTPILLISGIFMYGVLLILLEFAPQILSIVVVSMIIPTLLFLLVLPFALLMGMGVLV